jgi:hypothetical protein
MIPEQLIDEYRRGERDFRGSYLIRADLRDADLRGADLEDAKLEWANLERANLERANLEDANLERANLEVANLVGAKLRDANLEGANLVGAKLERAKLRFANLRDAKLEGANLVGAKLEWANLENANLERANLERAYLERANLEWANLEWAYFCGTCLDPLNHIEKISDEILIGAGFEVEGDFVIGYRTEFSMNVGHTKYIPGAVYTAPYFSTDSKTECHPGLYFAPLKWMKKHYSGYTHVRVAALNGEIIHAENKWRAKRLMVLPLKD